MQGVRALGDEDSRPWTGTEIDARATWAASRQDGDETSLAGRQYPESLERRESRCGIRAYG
jgi:hypothetical protein